MVRIRGGNWGGHLASSGGSTHRWEQTVLSKTPWKPCLSWLFPAMNMICLQPDVQLLDLGLSKPEARN